MSQNILTKVASGSSLLLKVLNTRNAKGILRPEDMKKAKGIADKAFKRRIASATTLTDKRFTDISKARKAISKAMMNGKK